METPEYFIQEARNKIKQNEFAEAEKDYLTAIEILNSDDKKESTLKTKSELWTTLSEYYWFKGILLENEVTRRHHFALKAIALMYKTIKLAEQFNFLEGKLKSMVDKTIMLGCIVPEDETHVKITCPIKIRNSGAGKFGFSIALFIKKATCSICGKNILDLGSCAHIPEEVYDGRKCYMKPDDVELNHLAIVPNPKDPNTRITKLSMPKKEFLSRFSKEQRELKEKEKLPIICSFCRQSGINPKEIDAKTFFDMQEIDFEKLIKEDVN